MLMWYYFLKVAPKSRQIQDQDLESKVVFQFLISKSALKLENQVLARVNDSIFSITVLY